MKYLIIRDDDFSFWSDVDEIQDIYSSFLDNGIFVSFGVIPKSVKSFNLGNYKTFYQDFDTATSIINNKKAIKFINTELKKSRIDILIHGFEHKYFFQKGDSNYLIPATKINLDKARNNNENIKFVGEFNQPSLSTDNYISMLDDGNEIFFKAFGKTSSIFVPPSNQMCENSLVSIQKNNLSISGLYGKDRKNIFGNIMRLYYPIRYNLFYPYLYKNQTNQLTYHSLTTESNFNVLINKLEISSKLNAPFQIATHYWELNSDLKNQLFEIIKYAKKIGYSSIKLSDIL